VVTPYKTGNMVRMLFHVTPWRGLNVLLGAMSLLRDCNVHVDIYSSCKIYGEDFEKQNDAQKKIEEQTKKNKESGKKKLKDLGLTDDEITALIGG